MRKIFSPSIALLNRLNYTKKFTLLWLLSLLAVAIVAYGLFVNLERIIKPSERELEGLTPIRQVSQVVQAIQLHRGISTALLGGNEAMRDRRAVAEKNVTAIFDATEGKLPPGPASSEDWRNIKASWKRLREDMPKSTVDKNLAGHTRLIEQLQLFMGLVADEYGLTLDPELASFYLLDTSLNKLPHTLEHLGQLRAYGTGILAEKRLTENKKIESKIMMAELGTALKALEINLEKTGHYNPAVQGSLRATYRNIINSVQQITDIVTSDILAGHFATHPDDFLDTATEVIDQSYAQLHDMLLPMAETLIKARIARTKRELFASVGISFLIFMLVVYTSISIYYAIIDSIRSLGRSARAFADGDLSTRIQLDTRDEFNWVGDSFNQMAEGFSALLAVHKEDEARLRVILDTALDAVVQMNAEGIITGWNNQAEKIFGWAREEALGRALHETIVPPQYREAHLHGLKRFLASGEGPVLNSRIEMASLHRDGREFPIELAVTPIEMGGKVEFNGFIRDISARKQAEIELFEKESQYRTAIDTAVDGFWMTDSRGRFIRVNDAYLHLSGYNRNELLGMSILDLEAEERHEETVAHMERLTREGSDKFESRHRRKDGSIWPVRISATYTPIEGGRYFVFITDLTERKLAENKMLQLAHYDTLTGLPNRALFYDRLA